MVENYLDDLIKRYPALESCKADIFAAYGIMSESFRSGGKLLIAGNGGSASDAEHIVGELMKGFRLSRKVSADCDMDFIRRLKEIDAVRGAELSEKLQKALPAISLCGHNALNTAVFNDIDGKICFAQQVYGYGSAGDVLLAISTSGNSDNILYAAVAAKALGLSVIGLTGSGGGQLASIADLTVSVDERETYKVQEMHLPIYHCICMMLEERFFGTPGGIANAV